jgi:hypothetical protein
LSLVRLSLQDVTTSKLYARPFLHANGYALRPDAADFFCRLYNCNLSVLPDVLRYAWISIELGSRRKVIATQRHSLLHAEAAC